MVQTERDRVIIRIFGDCGLRREELTQLRPEDVVRSGRQAYLRVLGKLDRVRDVPLPPPLLRRLERLIESRPLDRSADRIFISFRRGPGGEYEPLTSNGVYQVIKDAVARAGIKKRVHPHLLRHSWMTQMLRHGMSPIQLSIIAGGLSSGDLRALHPLDEGRRLRRHAPHPWRTTDGPIAAMRAVRPQLGQRSPDLRRHVRNNGGIEPRPLGRSEEVGVLMEAVGLVPRLLPIPRAAIVGAVEHAEVLPNEDVPSVVNEAEVGPQSAGRRSSLQGALVLVIEAGCVEVVGDHKLRLARTSSPRTVR